MPFLLVERSSLRRYAPFGALARGRVAKSQRIELSTMYNRGDQDVPAKPVEAATAERYRCPKRTAAAAPHPMRKRGLTWPPI